jgi:hypothetical protein
MIIVACSHLASEEDNGEVHPNLAKPEPKKYHTKTPRTALWLRGFV